MTRLTARAIAEGMNDDIGDAGLLRLPGGDEADGEVSCVTTVTAKDVALQILNAVPDGIAAAFDIRTDEQVFRVTVNEVRNE